MSESTRSHGSIPDAMPISRILRFALGLAMLAMVVPPMLAAGFGGQLRVLGVFVGLVVVYALVHVAVGRFFGWVNPYVGALIAVAPAAATLLLGDVYAAGAVLYIGASLLLIAVTGDPGCEVLAIQAKLSRRPTHLACLLFSPLDWLEGKIVGLAGGERDRG